MRVLFRIAAVIVITGVVVLLVARGQELWLVGGLVIGVAVAAVVGFRQRRLHDGEPTTGEFDEAYGEPGAEFRQPEEVFGERGIPFGGPPEAFGEPSEAFADPADAPGETHPNEPDGEAQAEAEAGDEPRKDEPRRNDPAS